MAGMVMTPEMLTSELNRIPPPSLTKLKQDLAMPDKDLTIMTPEEKVRPNKSWCILVLMSVNTHRCNSCSSSVETR